MWKKVLKLLHYSTFYIAGIIMDIQAENKRNLEFRNQQWQFFQSHPYFFGPCRRRICNGQSGKYLLCLAWMVRHHQSCFGHVSFDDDDARSDDHVQQIQP